ncbi:VCBS repeat-containing protein, partial [candidate division KSB1 bacterium]|nr:VCBS repeat-containing protein [candidate division KSB1 bacterium]
MRKSIFYILANILFLIQALYSQPNHSKLLYADFLDDPASTSAGVLYNSRGRFIPGVGWQTESESSKLMIALADFLPFEGTMKIDLTNFDPWNQNNEEALKQHIINLWSRSEADKSVYYTDAAWINIRTQRHVKYSAGEGKTGFKLLTQPRGFETRYEAYYMRETRWDANQTYTFQITWTRSKVYIYVDEILRATHPFSGQIEPFRYIFLGKDNLIYGYAAQVGPIFSNLRLYGKGVNGDSSLTFTDISDSAGVSGYSGSGYGQGATFADVNGDGWTDLFVSNATTLQKAPDLLYISQNGQSFLEQAQSRGTDDIGLTKCMAVADYNLDGFFDLFCGNIPLTAGDADGRNALYYNDGDGFFTNVTDQAGIAGVSQSTNGVLALDVEGDGDLDIFTVNPGELNEMYINNGAGVFTLETRGVEHIIENTGEFGRQGSACGDIDGDGDLDIYLCRRQESHLATPNLLYINDGSGYFTEENAARGVGIGGRSNGAVFVDIDNDGDLDLLVMNYAFPGGGLPLMSVLVNDGTGHFQDRSSAE